MLRLSLLVTTCHNARVWCSVPTLCSNVDIYETGKADCGRCKPWRSKLYGWSWRALANGQAVFVNQW